MPKLYYRIILIVLTVACGMGAVVTTPFAMFAAMAFDAPGSEHQLGAWVVFFVVLSIPLWFVLGAITGWVPVLAQLAASVCAHRRHTDCGYDHGLAAPATGITDAMGMLCPTLGGVPHHPTT
jgi:hypothetical protein